MGPNAAVPYGLSGLLLQVGVGMCGHRSKEGLINEGGVLWRLSPRTLP